MTEETALVEVPKQAIAKASPEEFASAFDTYLEIQKVIDDRMPKAIMEIKGKKFRKKEYWRAVATAFNLDVQTIKDEFFQYQEDWGFIVTCRASNPVTGRHCAGDGSCMRSEKLVYDYEWKGNKRGKRLGINSEKTTENATVHNIRGHAHTRAFNRAVSNLVGFGEVSADEMPHGSFTSAEKGSQETATEPPKAQEGASRSPADDSGWDGSKDVFFGKYSKEPEGPKTWAEVPSKYLEWVVGNMDPAKGPAVKMAHLEITRRGLAKLDKLELEANTVDAEVIEDAEMQARFDDEVPF